MKALRHLLAKLAVAWVIDVLFAVVCLAADTNSSAPTGLYMSAIGVPTSFIVRLGTNGNYDVRTEARDSILSQSQQGHWKWDERRQEFLLTPITTSAAFRYEFRRLRVDPQETNTLQWLPLHIGGGAGAGAIDYIRFKRKLE